MVATLENITVRADGFVVERENRGHGIYWVHVYGPANATRKAGYIVAAEARKWAAEDGRRSGGWVSGGGEFGGKGTWARTSKCYSFTSFTPVCDTIGCKAAATHLLSYPDRDSDTVYSDKVCEPCGESFTRRPALRATLAPLGSI